MPSADIGVIEGMVGVLTPIISLVTLVLVRALFKGNKKVEAAVNETEGEVLREIRNGVTDRLNELTVGQEQVKDRLTKLEKKIDAHK